MNSELSTITKQTMSSLEIAELTGKERAHINRDIKVMCEQLGYPILDNTDLKGIFVSKDERGYIKEILLDKDHALTLITGYDAKMRMAVNRRWQELESKAVVLPDFTNPAIAARAWADEVEAKLIAQEKIKEKDKYIVATNQAQIAAGEILVREFVKANDFIELGEKGFYSWMREQGIILKGSNEPYERFKKLGYFHWKPTEEMHGGKFRYTLTITPRGKVWLAARYMMWMDNQT